jgi:hypothetical protein
MYLIFMRHVFLLLLLLLCSLHQHELFVFLRTRLLFSFSHSAIWPSVFMLRDSQMVPTCCNWNRWFSILHFKIMAEFFFCSIHLSFFSWSVKSEESCYLLRKKRRDPNDHVPANNLFCFWNSIMINWM